ncbi:MAG: protein translocase subunit SecDF [Bacteroidetes bacterium SW_11_45_7]|nr:MAG: protein translocase subunit SecDF [Bacteroidetes bacterium SW_11_45_7]
MQGKALVKFFAVALILVCIYQLLFTFVSYRTESRAQEFAKQQVLQDTDANIAKMAPQSGLERARFMDSVNQRIRSQKQYYLDSIGGETVLDLGLVDYSYNDAVTRKLNLGLDLQGGMSVVLQVSMKETLIALSDDNQDEDFRQALELAEERQKQSQEDFVTLFGQAFEEVAPQKDLAKIYATPQNQDQIDFEASNQEVISFLRDKTDGAVQRTYNIIKTRIDRFGVTQPNIYLQEGANRIIVELPGVDNPDRIRNLLESTAELNFWETYQNRQFVSYLNQANNKLAEIQQAKGDTAAPDDTAATGSDIEEEFFGDNQKEQDTVRESTADTAPSDTTDEGIALSDEEGDTASEEEEPDLLGDEQDTAGQDEMTEAEVRQQNPLFYVLNPATYQNQETGQQEYAPGPIIGYSLARNMDKVERYLNMDKIRAVFPKDVVFLWGANSVREDREVYALYAIKQPPNADAPLSGDVIESASQDFGRNGSPMVTMEMNNEGARKWEQLTGENIDENIAIVLDERVYSAPTVQAKISGGRSQITGNFEVEEAQLVANILEAGALPLGEESIQAGLTSLIFGLILVLAFMILYYSSAGIISDLMLLLNLFFILGVLASFGASLTLPGMAGIVLTIGMAVDANVIIFERIREELNRDKGMRLAIVDGYTNSYSAIIDANLTTLITGVILLFFGLGPVQGFATVLVIGIFSSIFSAVLISRLIVDWWLSKDRKLSFFNQYTRNILRNTNFSFIDKRKITYAISGLVIALGIISMATKGFELGVDFQGGRTYVVRFNQPVNAVKVGEELTNNFGGSRPEVKTFGANNQVKITTSHMIGSDNEEADSVVNDQLYKGVKRFYKGDITKENFLNNYRMSSMKVGPTIADDITTGAFWATVFALLGIFLYILVRFRKWQFSIGAILAVVHDSLILLAVFSIFSGILPFSMQIDQAFIAALLTIIGYSINDTVVVFDRIREYLGIHQTTDLKTTINMAINGTLSRTFITSATTLLVVLILTFFGGEMIRGFSFALLIGILSGTYSSVFIATPVMVDLLGGKRPDKPAEEQVKAKQTQETKA